MGNIMSLPSRQIGTDNDAIDPIDPMTARQLAIASCRVFPTWIVAAG
jgi:hypothetical protein